MSHGGGKTQLGKGGVVCGERDDCLADNAAAGGGPMLLALRFRRGKVFVSVGMAIRMLRVGSVMGRAVELIPPPQALTVYLRSGLCVQD